MTESEFKAIIERELCPLLGAELSATPAGGVGAYKLASLLPSGGGREIALKPSRSASYRLAITRTQAFSGDELRLAQEFALEVGDVAIATPERYRPALLRDLMPPVLSRYLKGPGTVVQQVLIQLDKWAASTYEGRRIVASLAVDPEPKEPSTGVPFASFTDQAFAPVFGNGLDTFVVVGPGGDIHGFKRVSPGASTGFAPLRLRDLAACAEKGRLLLSLNHHGEILVFTDSQLRFAKRRDRWIHYVHDSVLKKLSPPHSRELRRALLESCLDASYARSGACIGVVTQKHAGKQGSLVDDADCLESATGIKAKLFASLKRDPFHDLDREIRLELLSMDGALVLDHKGYIIAVGAIVKVPGGSTAGGRQLAAQALSEIGLGVKVSADGPITGYRDKKCVFTS